VLNIPKSYCNNKYIDSYLFMRNTYRGAYIKGVGVDRGVGHIFRITYIGRGVQVLLVDRKVGSGNIVSGNGPESGGGRWGKGQLLLVDGNVRKEKSFQN